jgi:hypothetical protein
MRSKAQKSRFETLAMQQASLEQINDAWRGRIVYDQPYRVQYIREQITIGMQAYANAARTLDLLAEAINEDHKHRDVTSAALFECMRAKGKEADAAKAVEKKPRVGGKRGKK